jgi:hypothetical protein
MKKQLATLPAILVGVSLPSQAQPPQVMEAAVTADRTRETAIWTA